MSRSEWNKEIPMNGNGNSTSPQPLSSEERGAGGSDFAGSCGAMCGLNYLVPARAPARNQALTRSATLQPETIESLNDTPSR